jgi:hypothetical protein
MSFMRSFNSSAFFFMSALKEGGRGRGAGEEGEWGEEEKEKSWLFCFDDSRMVAVEGMQSEVKAFSIIFHQTESDHIT